MTRCSDAFVAGDVGAVRIWPDWISLQPAHHADDEGVSTAIVLLLGIDPCEGCGRDETIIEVAMHPDLAAKHAELLAEISEQYGGIAADCDRQAWPPDESD